MAERLNRDIMDQLSSNISDEVGNMHVDELDSISDVFSQTLTNALKSFNSSTFDDDGFIKRMSELDIDDSKGKDVMKNVLNNIKSDYAHVEDLNHSELLKRRDLTNICVQMPEMRDVINVVRDGIIECNVSTGEVSRSLVFENHENNESYESQAKEIEKRHNLLMAIKNFDVPKTLTNGEFYIQLTPFSKLFAEIEAIKNTKHSSQKNFNTVKGFRESVPNTVMNSFKESVSLYNEENVKLIMESASPMTKIESSDIRQIEKNEIKASSKFNNDTIAKEGVSNLLKSIDVYNGSSIMRSEMGEDAFTEFVLSEYKENRKKAKKSSRLTHFSEAMSDFNTTNSSDFDDIDQDDINDKTYSSIKGCYIKYLDPLRMVPIRIDRRIIGYYYVTTTMDLQTNPANPNGMIDLSYQSYTKDRNLVNNLASMIIRSFDKKMIEKNVKLKNEIAEILMAHKFSEGKLSFVYIPENEVIRFVINEDEEGRGHSILEPSIFPARNYLMLNMYNMLYTLNNNTTRIHYLKSSGLNKDYAAQIQRTMRKFQSRRITIDDIYSYSGVLNKVGGIGEMVLPAGRNDYKALETDTIAAVNNPIETEFLEQQRRQALSGTGVPHLLVINAIDEVDFAKTLEMANTRFLSTISSYKIDFNRGFTLLYQRLLKYETDLDDDIIQSFRFQFNPVKQQDLNITTDMIQNFNNVAEMVESIYYTKTELEDKDGNATPKRRHLRKELAKKYVPQLELDDLDEIIKRVDLEANDDILQQRVADIDIEDEDLDAIDSTKKK